MIQKVMQCCFVALFHKMTNPWENNKEDFGSTTEGANSKQKIQRYFEAAVAKHYGFKSRFCILCH